MRYLRCQSPTNFIVKMATYLNLNKIRSNLKKAFQLILIVELAVVGHSCRKLTQLTRPPNAVYLFFYATNKHTPSNLGLTKSYIKYINPYKMILKNLCRSQY